MPEKKIPFKILTTPKPPPLVDYAAIYKKAIHNKLMEAPTKKEKIADWAKQCIYLTVKGLPIIYKERVFSGFSKKIAPEKDEIASMWELIQVAQALISGVTPSDFIKIFPIEKKYDGHKYEIKDYWSTMRELNKIGMNNQIGNHVNGLLFDYQNTHVRSFNVFRMGAIDALRAYQGKPSMVEAFMSEKGVFPHRMMTAPNGKKFLYDPKNHTTIPVSPTRPRYLRLVKQTISERKE